MARSPNPRDSVVSSAIRLLRNQNTFEQGMKLLKEVKRLYKEYSTKSKKRQAPRSVTATPEVLVVPAAPAPRKPKAARRSYGDAPTVATTISRRELVTTLRSDGTANDQLFHYNVSPEAAGAFPWLAQVAPSWTQYRFTSVTFEWVPHVGQFSSNGVVGAVAMGYDPDVMSSDITNRIGILELQGAKESRLDRPIQIKANNSKLLNWYNIGLAANDEQFDDQGKVHVLVNTPNQTAGVAIGDLFVRYTVHLRGPRFAEVGSKTGLIVFGSENTANVASSSFFGSPVLIRTGSTLTATSVYVDTINKLIKFMRAGRWFLNIYWTSSTAAIASDPTYIPGTGISMVNGFSGVASPGAPALVYTDGYRSVLTLIFDVELGTAGYGQIDFGGNAGLASAYCDIYAIMIPANLAYPRPGSLAANILRKYHPVVGPATSPAEPVSTSSGSIEEVPLDSHEQY